MTRSALRWSINRPWPLKLFSMLAVVAGFSFPPVAQAVGLTYVDADPFVNLSPMSAVIFTAGNSDAFWGRRQTFGAVDGGNIQAIYESGITEDSPLLTQTISGLTPGSNYDMYVVYWSNPNNPQDWRIRAGLSPESLQDFNRLGPTANLPTATAGNYASAGVWDSPPLNAGSPIFSATNLRMFVAKAGTAVADGSGQAQLYIDDVPIQGTNFRTWFDGVAYAPAGTAAFLTATVDRASGTISINNDTTLPFTVKSYSIASASGSLDATQWIPITGHADSAGNGSFDNDPWAVTAPADPGTTPFATLLSEGATAGTGGLLAAGGSTIPLGNLWRQTPYQDLIVSLTLSDNSTINITPTYLNTAIAPGDFDGNGSLDLDDYQTLMSNIHTDVSSLTMAERYIRGDVTRNGVIDYYDFNKFAVAYDNLHGDGSFGAMASQVPEASSCALLLMGISLVTGATRYRRRRQGTLRGTKAQFAAAVALVVVAGLASPATGLAAPVVGWTLDPTFGGGLNGTTILTSAETNSPTVGDGFVTNNASNLAMYATIPQVNLAPGEQIVLSGSLTINGINNTLAGEFRIGLFQENADPPATTGWLGFMTRSSAGEDTGSIISRNPAGTGFAAATSFSDLAGRATLLAVGGNSNMLASGDYTFQMTIGRFDDQSVTAHASLISANGYALNVYRATEDNVQRTTFDFNRAGFLMGNALNATQIAYSNIDASVQSIVAPKLQVSSSGELTIVNPTGATIDLKYYEITSASGALSTGGWNSLDSTEGNDPYGTGWDVTGGSNANLLSEGRLVGATALNSGGMLSLGNAAQAGGAQDLRFFYGLPDGSIYRGLVEYAPGVQGDFDGDGDVDGADFVAWQTNFPKPSSATQAQGDADGDGDVDGADFGLWQSNFPLGGSGSSPVPEPQAWLTALLLAAGLLNIRRNYRRGRR